MPASVRELLRVAREHAPTKDVQLLMQAVEALAEETERRLEALEARPARVSPRIEEVFAKTQARSDVPSMLAGAPPPSAPTACDSLCWGRCDDHVPELPLGKAIRGHARHAGATCDGTGPAHKAHIQTPVVVAPTACREDCVGTCADEAAAHRKDADGWCFGWTCSDPAHRPPVAAGAVPAAPPAPAFALSDEERELVLYWSDNSDPDVERLDGTILARALARACAALGVRL